MWDHAAGVAVLEAAGGCVVDMHGKELVFTHGSKLEENWGIVAASLEMRSSVERALRELFSICSHDSSLPF